MGQLNRKANSPFVCEEKKAIKWLLEHPVWYAPVKNLSDLADSQYLPDFGFYDCVDICPVFVNPNTNAIDDDESKNTTFRVWLEASPPSRMPDDIPMDDEFILTANYTLNCGGYTLNEALFKLANLVKAEYGEYEDLESWEEWHKTHPHGLLRFNATAT